MLINCDVPKMSLAGEMNIIYCRMNGIADWHKRQSHNSPAMNRQMHLLDTLLHPWESSSIQHNPIDMSGYEVSIFQYTIKGFTFLEAHLLE